MSPRGWKERVQDILDAISEIQSFTRSLDFEKSRSDVKTIRAVELDFIVIGEAVTKSLKKFKKLIPRFRGT